MPNCVVPGKLLAIIQLLELEKEVLGAWVV